MRIHKNLYVGALFLVVSFICMLFLTTASPLYSVNLSPDGNTMFTVGKGLLHGLMPYKDLFDQRGPLIYLMNSVAALISYKTFFGIYIFESIAMFLDLFFVFKILNLKYNKKMSIMSTFIVIPLVFTSKTLAYGNLPEEYVLPLIFITIYMITYKSVNDWGRYEYFIIGFFISISFWIKYTLSITWIAIYLVLTAYFIYRKSWKKMFTSILYGIVGFLPVTLLITMLYTCKHALYDLFYVYFYLNISTYSGKISIVPIQYIILFFIISVLFILIYMIVYDLSKLSKYTLSIAVICNYLLVNKIGFMLYYFEITLFAFIIVPIMFCYILNKYNTLHHILYIVPLVCILGMFFTNKSFLNYSQLIHKNNPYIDAKEKNKVPIFKEFSKIINQSKDKTILNYTIPDRGIYTYSGILPSNKYFIINNMDYAPMKQSIKNSLKLKKDKFVFMGYTKYPTQVNGFKLSRKEIMIIKNNYKMVDSRTVLFELHHEKYVLYERKD